MKNKFKELNCYLHSRDLYDAFYYNVYHYCKPNGRRYQVWAETRSLYFNSDEKFSLSTYIQYGFIWADTPQGSDFWDNIYSKLINEEAIKK